MRSLIKRLREYFARPYIEEIERLNKELKRKLDPMSIVHKVFRMDLPWVNYQDFDSGKRDHYYKEAQLILQSFVIQNELNFIRVNWAKKAMLEISNDAIEDKAKHLEKICWMLIGMETLRDRLADIQAPKIENVSDLE